MTKEIALKMIEDAKLPVNLISFHWDKGALGDYYRCCLAVVEDMVAFYINDFKEQNQYNHFMSYLEDLIGKGLTFETKDDKTLFINTVKAYTHIANVEFDKEDVAILRNIIPVEDSGYELVFSGIETDLLDYESYEDYLKEMKINVDEDK